MSVDRIVKLFRKLLPCLFVLTLLSTLQYLLLPVVAMIDLSANGQLTPEELTEMWLPTVFGIVIEMAKLLFLFGIIYVLLDIRDRADDIKSINNKLHINHNNNHTEQVIRLFQKALPIVFLITLLYEWRFSLSFFDTIRLALADQSLFIMHVFYLLSGLGYLFKSLIAFGTVYIVLDIYRRVITRAPGRQETTAAHGKGMRRACIAFFERYLLVITAAVVGLVLLPGLIGMMARMIARPPQFEDTVSLDWYFEFFPYTLHPTITLLLTGAVLYLVLGIRRSLPAENFAPVSDHRNPLRERIIRAFERSLPFLFLVAMLYTLVPEPHLLSVDLQLFVDFDRLRVMATLGWAPLVLTTSIAFAAATAYTLLDIRDRLPPPVDAHGGNVNRIVRLFRKILLFLFIFALISSVVTSVATLIAVYDNPLANEYLDRAWVSLVGSALFDVAKILFLFGAVYVLLDVRDRLGNTFNERKLDDEGKSRAHR